MKRVAERRDAVVTAALTHHESRQLTELAKRSGQTRSTIIRDALLPLLQPITL